MTIFFIGLALAFIFTAIWSIITCNKLQLRAEVLTLKLDELEVDIKNYQQKSASAHIASAKALVGEACLLKAFNELQNNDGVNGAKYANEWLDKRELLKNEIEEDSQNTTNIEALDEIYISALRIAEMIYKGELDIKRE